MLVPRSLENEVFLTLTWTSKDFELNLMAQTFIDTDSGVVKGENCVLSFGNPKCAGMMHLASREKSTYSESVRFNSNLFYDADKKLIKNKKVMVYVYDTKEKDMKEISQSGASIGISMPAVGQITQVTIPFKTREEE